MYIAENHFADRPPISSFYRALAFSLGNSNSEQANNLYLRALASDEKYLGRTNPELIEDLDALGNLRAFQSRIPEAREYFLRSLSIAEKAPLELRTKLITDSLYELAGISETKFEDISLYERALKLHEEAHDLPEMLHDLITNEQLK